MKLKYKGHTLDAHREKSMSGASLVFYSAFRDADQYEITSGFSYGIVRDCMAGMKAKIDGLCESCGNEDAMRTTDDGVELCDECYDAVPLSVSEGDANA